MTGSAAPMADEAEERTTALGLLNTAGSYLDAAEHLAQAIDTKRLKLDYRAPVDLLLGHSVELLLKAYLRSKGWSLDDLKDKAGHDIAKLLRAARSAGLNDGASKKENFYVLCLNERFGKWPYTIRYIETGTIVHDDKGVVMAWARRVEEEVRPAILAD